MLPTHAKVNSSPTQRCTARCKCTSLPGNWNPLVRAVGTSQFSSKKKGFRSLRRWIVDYSLILNPPAPKNSLILSADFLLVFPRVQFWGSRKTSKIPNHPCGYALQTLLPQQEIQQFLSKRDSKSSAENPPEKCCIQRCGY